MEESGGEYFPGVRLHDPFFGNPPQFTESHNSGRFTFIELFAGIGGFRLGLEAIGGQCVFASEIDREAKKTYTNNFGKSELYGDITDFYANQLPPFDIVTGGFPCQPFSVRGEQQGLNDPNGMMYLELTRVLTECKPKAFLFENVPSLVTMRGGKRNRRGEPMALTVMGEVFGTMLKAFQDCGYDVSWDIVSARHWLPQHRERVYIVGFRSDLRVPPMDWSLGRGQQTAEGAPALPGLSSTVRDILEPPDTDFSAHVLSEQQYAKICSPEFLAKTEFQHAAAGPDRRNWIMLESKAPTLTSSYRNVSSFTTKYIFQEADGQLRTLPRFLTQRECARLMGFPDSFAIPQDTTFYHQIGNAVCPPVIQAIGQVMIDALTAAASEAPPPPPPPVQFDDTEPASPLPADIAIAIVATTSPLPTPATAEDVLSLP
jgi:DNA (cytosine-5)-methyltransferase 1